MGVYLMCSGPTGLKVARALKDMLESLVGSHDYYLYADSNSPGEEWDRRVSAELRSNPIGVAVITPDSIRSEWIHFEAGAIAGPAYGNVVVPYLVGIGSEHLRNPMGRFTSVRADADGTRKLVLQLAELSPTPTKPDAVTRAFSALWRECESEIQEALAPHTSSADAVRSPGEMLAEVVELTRSMARYLRTNALQRAGMRVSVSVDLRGDDIRRMRTLLADFDRCFMSNARRDEVRIIQAELDAAIAGARTNATAEFSTPLYELLCLAVGRELPSAFDVTEIPVTIAPREASGDATRRPSQPSASDPAV